jgi:hypothetical protein
MMRIARFRRLLDIHGPDLARWPAPLVEPARKLVATDPMAKRELMISQRLDALIVNCMERGLAGPAATVKRGDSQMQRTLAALRGPLPPQQRRWLTAWIPAVLLEFDFAPAWPRMAALAGVAGLGFMIGLTDLNLTGTRGPASVGSGADSDLSMIVFDQDPLSGLRP